MIATTSTEVPEKPACLNDGTVCAPGTPVAIKVNTTDVYNFYVLSESENEITLIMDRNIYAQGNTTEPDVAWVSKEHYNDDTNYGTYGNNNKGPKTAVAELKTRTSGWINIPEKTYTYSDDGGGNKYESFSETMRARMLTLTEAKAQECEINAVGCLEWMYINLKGTGDNNTEGYWLSAVRSDTVNSVYYVKYNSIIGRDIVPNATTIGVRPVITLSK